MMDFGYTCPCGREVTSEEYLGGWSLEHERSDEHMDGLIARYTDDDWESWVEEIEHGLGWAASEGASTGKEDEVVGVARALIRERSS